MKIKDIIGLVDGKVFCCEDRLDISFEYAFASDLMSDVLTVEEGQYAADNGTGEYADYQDIRNVRHQLYNLARDKRIGEEMISLARENNMTLIGSPTFSFPYIG